MQQACFQFKTIGAPISSERYGNGHINETYLVKTDSKTWYILQKINARVFGNVRNLMHNITSVTRFLALKDSDPRHVLTVVPTLSGEDFLKDDEGYWRMYIFVTDSICLERAESDDDFRASGVAFGRFQSQLADFSTHTLHEVIPQFHDTVARLDALEAAYREDKFARSNDTNKEYGQIMLRKGDAGSVKDMVHDGKLPLRVTHNDTKLNNVMLDASTRQPLCVIDLDTVMPGLAGNDFGDSIRFGANFAAEDERNLQRVGLSLPLFRACAEGFLSTCKDSLSQNEIDTLPLCAKVMTLESAARFLTDHLKGDTYFHIKYPDHNLVRARTQLKLLESMEENYDAMRKIVREAASR